jgi:ATP/maltotriose-dependent transcriptional regulator MalT/DNA-binding SARP family transcriptional activator
MGSERVSRGKIARPVPAKVTPPEITRYFPRKRLFRLLDAARKRPVVWISAPPGSGKTTLASSYIDVRRLPRLWYQMDERDADVATFFHHMGLAAQRAAPRKRKPMPLLTPEYLPGLPAFTRRFFDVLFTRLPAPSVVVFDNYQKIPPESMLHDVIRDAAACLPRNVNFLLVSRSAPPPAFARMSANRLSSVIGWEEMRLTGEETRGIVRLHARRPFRGEEIRRLEESADGWVSGLVLMLEKAAVREVVPERKGTRTPEEIVDYFVGEVFGRMDPETRAFLVRTAFLPRMTARTAEALTGNPKAARILSYLNRHNFFTEVHPGEEPVYEFHSLFRGFLLHHAEGALSTEEACATRHRAAALLEDSGHAEDAVDLLRRCDDFRGVCRVIRNEAPSLVREGGSRTLGERILSLPGDLRADAPWLLYWTGVCSKMPDPAESRAAFERALDLFSRAGEEAGAFLSWSGIVDTILFQWNDFRSLDRWIDWLDRRLAEGAAFPSAEIEARVSASMAGALHHRRPQHPSIRAWIDRALSASRAAGDENLALRSLVLAANHHHWTGDRSAAFLALKEVRLLSRSKAASPVHAILGMSVEASTLLWADADTGGALRIVAEGLDAVRRIGASQWEHLFFAAGAYAALLAGDGKAAGEYLRKVKAVLPGSWRFADGQYDHLCALLHLFREDRRGAAAHAGRALASAEAAGSAFPEILCRLAAANIAEGRGEREESKAHLRGVRDRILASGNKMFEFMERLTEARLAFGSGDEDGGLQALREGMTLGREQGYVSLFWWWEPKAMTRLCTKALEAGIEEEYVLGLIRRNRLVPDPSAVDLESWPWPVKVYTLGRFSLVVDGKILPSARKTRQKPLLLLKALIALGGREVPEEQFTEILWPDADGDLAHQSLAKTLERLREMLGDDRAVILRDGRLTLNNRHCWVDVWELERTLGRADAGGKPGAHALDGGEVARIAERAITLYRGTFLSGETFCSNIVTYRERLRSKFIRDIELAGRYWEQAGEGEKAIVFYRRGLEIDPLSEDLSRCLISCCVRMGRIADARAVYQQCCKTFSAVLGVSPSSDLHAMLTPASTAPPAPLRK